MGQFFSGAVILLGCVTTFFQADESPNPPASTSKVQLLSRKKPKVSSEILSQIRLAHESLKTNPQLAATQIEEVLCDGTVLPEPLLAFALWIQGSGLSISEDHPRAVEVLLEAETAARNCGEKKSLRRILRYKAASCFECSMFKEGRDAAIESIEISKEIHDQSAYVAIVYNEAANNEFALGNTDDALEYLNKAIQISEQSNDKNGLSKWLVNVSNIMLELKRYDEAVAFSQRVLNLQPENSKSLAGAAANGIIGEAMTFSGRYADAQRHLQKSLELCDSMGSDAVLASTQLALGGLYKSQQQFYLALIHFRKALQTYRRLQNPSGIASAQQAIRRLQSSDDLKEAITAIKKELSRAEQSGELRLQLSLQTELAESMEASGRMRKSAAYAVKASQLSRDLQQTSFSNQIASALASLSYSEKLRLIDDLKEQTAAQNDLLVAEKRWNKTLIYSVCILLAVATIVAVFWLKMRKAVAEVKRAENLLKQQKTVQLNMERQLAEQQKSDSLSLMAAGIAHDFNNVLSAVVGFAELGSVTASTTEKDEFLHQISVASMEASGLTNQLLQFLGKTPSDVGQCDVVAVLDSTQGLLQSMARPNAVILNNHSSELHAPIDDTRLRQILVNLVGNSAEASEGDSFIRVCVETASITADEVHAIKIDSSATAGDFCRISVKDFGHGMSDETKARLFDPYFSTKGVGRGLGLSSVIGIVRSCGGFVQVLSSEGEGCEFNLYLPQIAADQAAEAGVRMPPMEPAGKDKFDSPPCVMVVDDEEMILEMQSQYLQIKGFDVITATSAEKALELAADGSNHIDCYVTDFCMNGKDGKWLAQQIKLRQPDVPVILCSGYSSEILEPDEDITMVLAKPNSPAVLAEAIEECLRDCSHLAVSYD